MYFKYFFKVFYIDDIGIRNRDLNVIVGPAVDSSNELFIHKMILNSTLEFGTNLFSFHVFHFSKLILTTPFVWDIFAI